MDATRPASDPFKLTPALLALIEDEEPTANAGDRQVSVDERGTARDLLQTRISCARYPYCAASDELHSTKELAKISFQPRRRATPARPDTDTPPVTPIPPSA